MKQKILMSFEELQTKLRDNGFIIDVIETDPKYYEETIKIATFKGNKLKGGFAEKNKSATHDYINERIAFDHKDCFDKWSKCPCSFPFPSSEEELEFLLDRMEFYGSKEGLKLSNSFEYEFEDSYPRNLKPKKEKQNERARTIRS